MSVWERLTTGIGYIFGGGKVAYEMIPTWQQGKAAYPAANFVNNVTLGFSKNELIYASTALMGDSAASATLRVFSKRDGKELTDHPIRNLLTRPNKYMTEFDFFSMTLVHLQLAGVSYWEKVRSRAGRVVELWPLRPDWVRPVIGNNTAILSYEYHVPGISPIPLKLEDVLEFKLHDPLNVYAGHAPASVAARVGAVDNATTDYLRLFMENGGVPPYLLTSKMKLKAADVERIRAGWRERYGGWRNWADPAVLDSDASMQKMGLTFQEMGFEGLDARSEARICMVLRVPPMLIGAKVGIDRSTFSNAEQAEKYFWRNTLFPQYKRLRDELQHDLGADYGDIDLQWDFSEVPALQEDRNARWVRATAALAAGAITRNMFYAEVGLPSIGPAGDVYIQTLNQVAVPAKMPAASGGKVIQFPHVGHKEAEDAPDADDRHQQEANVIKAMNKFLKSQLDRVIENVA